MRTWLIAALVVVGCGGSNGAQNDRLAGTDWALTQSTCALIAQFDDASGFTMGEVCQDSNGTLLTMVDGGTYALSGNTLSTLISSSSCPLTSADVNGQSTVAIGTDTLSMTGASGAIVFSRVTPGAPTGAVVQYGCFDSAGNFSPMAIHSVP